MRNSPLRQLKYFPAWEDKMTPVHNHLLSLSLNPRAPRSRSRRARARHPQAARECRLEEAASSAQDLASSADTCLLWAVVIPVGSPVVFLFAPDALQNQNPNSCLRLCPGTPGPLVPSANAVSCFSFSSRLSAVPGLQCLLHLLLSKSVTSLPPSPPLLAVALLHRTCVGWGTGWGRGTATCS